MNEPEYMRSPRWYARFVPCWALLLSTWVSVAYGTDPSHNSNSDRDFILDSRVMVQASADPQEVLSRLTRIATSKNSDSSVQKGALHAFFHIADTDEQIREGLLQLLTMKSDAIRGTLWEAGRLITYVADRECCQVLAREYTRNPSSRRAEPIILALVEIGDNTILGRLRTLASDMDEPGRRPYFEDLIQRIELQDSVDSVLNHLRGGANDGPSPSWAVFQASKHGAEKDELRAALFEYLSVTTRNDGRRAGLFESALRAGVSCGVLSRVDIDVLKQLGVRPEQMPEFRIGIGMEDVWPPWATKVIQKEREFWRIDKLRTGSP